MIQRERGGRRAAAFGVLGNLSVPGTRAGAIVSLGMVILAWIAIPVARPVILGTCGAGLALGLALWRKHNR